MTEKLNIADKIRAHKALPPPAMRRALRVASGLTQADIAAPVQVHRAAISRYESGVRTPRGRHLIAYVAVLEELRRAMD